MATAQIKITADTAQAERALGGLNRSLSNLAGLVAGAFGAREFAAFADSVTNLQNKLNQLTPGIRDTGAQMNTLNGIVQRTGIELTSVGDVYFRFARNAEALGITQTEVATATETLAGALALGGMSAADASGALLQMGQALQSGTFQGDELRSVLEGMPLDVVQGLADSFGVTAGELKKLGSEGKITASAFTQAILGMSSQVKQQVEGLAPTFESVFNRISSNIAVAFGNSETYDSLVTALDNVATSLGLIGQNTQGLTTFIDGMGQLLQILAAFTILRYVTKWMQDLTVASIMAGDKMKGLGGIFGLVNNEFKFFGTTFQQVGAAMSMNAPIVARLGTALSALLTIGLRFAGWVGIFLAVVDAINWVGRAFFDAQGDVISFSGIMQFLGDVVQVSWYLLKELGSYIGSFFSGFVSSATGILTRFISTFTSLGLIIGFVSSEFFQFTVVRTVTGWVGALIDKVRELTGWLGRGWDKLKERAGVPSDGERALERIMNTPIEIPEQYRNPRPARVPLGPGTGGGGGGGAREKSSAELIAEATAERNKQYQQLIKSQQDSLFLTQFEGVELETQRAILEANNQLVRDITDSKGRVIGQTQGLNALEQQNLTTLIRQNAEAKARVEITRANRSALEEAGLALRTATMTPEDRAVEEAIFKNRQQYGSAYTAELEAQDRIQQRQIANLNQQAQVAQVLNDITRQRTQLEIAQAASSMYGQTMEGMLQQQQQQMEALNFLREQGLISEQSYLNQRILINQQAQDAILQYEQKVAATRLQQAGVTNDAIIQSVQAMQQQAAMIQQGGIVGAQGMLGAFTQIMGQMGQTSEKSFKAYKALAIAQAIISTYQAAAMALTFPPGPPISYLYVAAAVASGLAQVAQIRKQQYQGRALGGPVMGQKPYIVGEHGPELFVPQGTGSIVRNGDAFGGGGSPLTVQFNILANDTTGFDELLTSRRALITQIIRDAQLEQGQRM